jgi:polysaccharide deacetylase family protein (PEP-CTERM system associated)
MWALDVLVEKGFKYDSSIYPVHHDNYGIPGAKVDPHILVTPAGYEIIELPLSSVGSHRVRLPVGGGGYFRLYPYWLTRLLLKGMNRRGRGFVFYCHPWEFDPDQPRVDNASRLSKFRHYNNLAKFRGRVITLVQDFEVTTCWDVIGRSSLVTPSAVTSPGLSGI